MSRRDHALRILVAAVVLPGCGTERTLSGVWRQACGETGEACADERFVYKLHLGRFGTDMTGLVVRYANVGGDSTFDPPRECGCFLVTSGSASDTQLSFDIEPGTPGRFGCPTPAFDFAAEGCREALETPPCRSMQFRLAGTDEALEGTISCDDAPEVPIAFTVASERLRKTCLGTCENAPDAGEER